MRLLLDTNGLLRALSDELGADARAAVTDPANDVLVSPVAPWEIESKRATGRLVAPENVLEAITGLGFEPLPITLEHAVAAGRLPLHHRDPFDRMVVAQASAERLVVLTSDPLFAAYGVPTLAG